MSVCKIMNQREIVVIFAICMSIMAQQSMYGIPLCQSTLIKLE